MRAITALTFLFLPLLPNKLSAQTPPNKPEGPLVATTTSDSFTKAQAPVDSVLTTTSAALKKAQPFFKELARTPEGQQLLDVFNGLKIPANTKLKQDGGRCVTPGATVVYGKQWMVGTDSTFLDDYLRLYRTDTNGTVHDTYFRLPEAGKAPTLVVTATDSTGNVIGTNYTVTNENLVKVNWKKPN